MPDIFLTFSESNILIECFVKKPKRKHPPAQANSKLSYKPMPNPDWEMWLPKILGNHFPLLELS